MNSPTVIFEDVDIMVVDKPAGMVVNRADSAQYVKTLQEWIEEKLKVKRPLIDSQTDEMLKIDEKSDFYRRSGIVHRLDKETSGLIIIAKNASSFQNLQAQFKEGNVSKTYHALVHGRLSSEIGEIKLPIGRLPWNKMRFGVFPAGRESRTLYKVLWVKKFGAEPEEMSYVEVYPKTGRTHQIRVHFQYLRHPIFADELYAGRKTSKKDRKHLARHFLHAVKITFTHPTTHENVEFESSLPQDLADFLGKLI